MSDVSQHPFLAFLEGGIERGGFETDDALAAVLPLMKQVLAAHDAGNVAPLEGLAHLVVGEHRQLAFDPAQIVAPRSNVGRIERVQAPVSHGVEVVDRTSRVADIDSGTLQLTSLDLAPAGHEIVRPVYRPGYVSWEHDVGHHDELTDIFSLGLILASVACGLNFADSGDLEAFVVHRDNLFGLNARLNPVLASVITQMTALNRHRRAQDLASLIGRLENYREQTTDLDATFTSLKGFKESTLAGKRTLIQAHLRDRLFEISRRNRLIYFKPTLQTLNLTIASVPILLDYRNIRLEQLFVWHPSLANTICGGAPMSLGKHLRFEDAPYVPGALDKIIAEARRDRAEYGFAQLRLVLCFLRWNNLKETPGERIVSPLLLLPVELTKKKGVRDNYILDPTTGEAEVNPALRHHLKELYNLNLPETVDLRETSLDQLHEALEAQIQATEPGVTLNKIDRPPIQLIHERARQRLDQYRQRLRTKGSSIRRVDDSHTRDDVRPAGLRLFLEKVRPSPAPLRDAVGAPPVPRPQAMVPAWPVAAPSAAGEGQVLEASQQTYALRGDDSHNPYSWDFDLCNVTLGNFNYRKMTLVRDYENLIDTDLASAAFDTIFSLSPRPPDDAPRAPLELGDQHLIIACDATQASAIARARTGRSYIIQGPPGTGKSQTITNLIADYVARGKRVLFVCEKRAAIDIVFHRLRQQGLDELCCLIHDSQADKKAFIQNLKQTYEKLLAAADGDGDAEKARTSSLKGMQQDLAGLHRFSEAMGTAHEATGLPVRSLLQRLIEVDRARPSLSPELEEQLPEYALWQRHGDVVNRLGTALSDQGDEPCFARHPLRWLGKGVLQADRPLEAMATSLDEAEALIDEIENALELSGLPPELWTTLDGVHAILEFAARARPVAERDLSGLFDRGSPASTAFTAVAAALDEKAGAWATAREKTANWKDPFAADDTQSALTLARGFERSLFRFLQPGFWRLRQSLRGRYDFGRHAVAPPWTRILGDLAAEQHARADYAGALQQARLAWRTEDPDQFRQLVTDLRSEAAASHPSVRSLVDRLADADDASELVIGLARIHPRFDRLTATLDFLLAESRRFTLQTLEEVIGGLREQTRALPDLLPVLAEVADLPDAFAQAVRHVPMRPDELEAAIALKSLNGVYRRDRALTRFDGRTLAQRVERLAERYASWLDQNARSIRADVGRRFLDDVHVSSLPASQLDPGQKAFKKTYTAGRRDLEHEFGKTMRYKSIRELAAGPTGRVIRDLKPVWLMSPLSVSDTLPLDPTLFDVVIFDEASQIPVEEAIPAVYRSNQVIVVGDEMQLPPTTFFAAGRGEDDTVVVEEDGERIEVDLDSDSFLTQCAMNLPSTLLAWHYRSRYEALISFSNAAYYGGNLFTIPDRHRALAERSELRVSAANDAAAQVDALLARSISFHLMETAVYADRRNAGEASYVARLVRELLRRPTGLSIGVVAFSEAQQAEIEGALTRLAEEDPEFANRLEAEYVREENDQFCGLFVKNLENVQGDERDIVLLSICYGRDAGGKMLMNFGPINQRGGEKRLNVIFSRAKHHMAVISSIRHRDITNTYNDGANSLRSFLQYAEAASRGDEPTARRVLESLNPLARTSLSPEAGRDAVVEGIAEGLRARGYAVDLHVGRSKFRCDLAVRAASEELYRLGVMVDTDSHYANPNLLDRYVMQPSILRAFGWRFALVLAKDWFHDAEHVLDRLERVLEGTAAPEDRVELEDVPEPPGRIWAPAAATGPEPDPRQGSTAVEPVPDLPAPAMPAPSPSTPATRTSRYFEFVSGSSSKFWEISLDGSAFTVRFGRIGTAGQAQSKTFGDAAKASREMEKLIAEKLKKGYREGSSTS